MAEGMADRSLPDLLLERYLLGELPAERLREVKRRLDADPEMRARLENLRAANEAFLRAGSPENLARRLADRLRRERIEEERRREENPDGVEAAKKTRGMSANWGRPAFAGVLFLALMSVPAWHTWKTLGATSAVDERSGAGSGFTSSVPETARAAANASGATSKKRGTGEGESRASGAAVAVAEAPARPDTRADARPDTRLKGLEPGLALFRKMGEGSEPLRPGAKVRPGDVLRVGYRAAGASYGAIYSLDGNGGVTRHWPREGDRAARLEPGEHLLPDAFELDAAPDYERFYFLVSDTSFGLSPILRNLKDLQSTKLGDANGIRVIRFDLLKDIGT